MSGRKPRGEEEQEFYNRVLDKIEDIKIDHNYEYADLAKAMKCDRRHVWDVFNERSVFSIYEIHNLCVDLKIGIDTIFETVGSDLDENASHDARKLMEDYNSLGPRDRELVGKVVEAMKIRNKKVLEDNAKRNAEKQANKKAKK